MVLEEIREIAREWIVEKGNFSEPWEVIEDLILKEPKTAFRIIEEIHHLIVSSEPIDYQLMGLLAASHLEELLCESGREVIESIEFLANQDKEFRKCLCGVWKNEIPDGIYSRVQKQSHPTFRFA